MRRQTVFIGTVIGLLIAGFASAYGQVFEDEMEPEEIGIADIDSLTVPLARYVGNDTCKACHADVYRKWLGTKHSRAFVPLSSRTAIVMGEKDGVTASHPARCGKCLSCHATAHDVPATHRGPEVRMGEGVTCEKCHGPGEKHVKAMEHVFARAYITARTAIRRMVRGVVPETYRLEALERSTVATCMVCHTPEASHEMLKSEPFAFAKSWKKVAH